MFTRNRISVSVSLAIALVIGHLLFGAGAVWLSLGSGVTPFAETMLVLVYVPFVVTGAVVAARHPRNPVGWLLAGVGFGANLGFFVQEYAIRANVAAPGSLPLGPTFAWASFWIWNVTLGSLLFAVLFFPTGRLASPRWRPLAWFSGTLFAFVTLVFAFAPGAGDTADAAPGLVNPLAIEALRPVGRWVDDSFWIFLLVFGLAAASVVARFRASRGVERQQLKWAAGGCALAAASLAASNFGGDTVASAAWIVGLLAIPSSFAVAMLRYRLYDIDALINRGLVYGTLSTLLVGAYVALVVVLGALVRPLTGSGDVTVAASTLAVLALFQPLRAWIQRFVDRRFYRSRYDARRTVDRFGARLRDQVDLDQLRAELIRVVDDTIKPSHASLWLRR